jgi:hypothetical protein
MFKTSATTISGASRLRHGRTIGRTVGRGIRWRAAKIAGPAQTLPCAGAGHRT